MKPDVQIESVGTRVYEIPTDEREADGTLAWSSTVMVVVKVHASGHEGLGWTYCASAAKAVIDERLADVVTGMNACDVQCANQAMLRACRNLGEPGIAACALSALDVALWDLKARLLDVSLASLIGRGRTEVPVYGSGGFTTYDDETMAGQLERWIGECGLSRVKIKIGESWGSREARDLHRVGLARGVVGDDVELYVDANGAYRVKQAVRLGRAMSERWSVTWFEEPVSSDDLRGLRQVREQCAIDIAAGEYGYSPWYFVPMVTARAVDCLQADVTRCGGVTAWLAIANLAAAHQLDISGHCAPNLHAHVALSAPNLRHLEYFHDHVRIEGMLVDGALAPHDGALHPRADVPGHGLTFKDADAERFRIA